MYPMVLGLFIIAGQRCYKKLARSMPKIPVKKLATDGDAGCGDAERDAAKGLPKKMGKKLTKDTALH